MKFALGSVTGSIEAVDSDDPDTARKKHARIRSDRPRVPRRAFAWGLAMLFLGLSAGLMINGIIAGQPGNEAISDSLTMLQLILFLGAICALLFLLLDSERETSNGASAAKAEEARSAVNASAAHASMALSPTGEDAHVEAASAQPVAASAADRDPFAPLRENDAELLQRLVMNTDRYDIVCDKIARRYLLSPRQAEVLNLLARGHNASYIEDKLCISLSTAKSHISGVYRKLGVHTQQELLAFVQNEIDETDRK